MRVTLASVISLDGRITRGDDPNVHAWSSAEDWRHFIALRAKHDVVVMDRTTYEAVKPEPVAGLLRIVLTNHAGLYAGRATPSQLEFMALRPKPLLAELTARGYMRVLLAGGSTMSADFLNEAVVDDVYLTFEPLLFGAGKPVIATAQALGVQLRLQEVTQLNKQGTLLAHYTTVR
jgi:dihydrofolate reductase